MINPVDIYIECCRKHDPSLPEGWEPYLYECLPLPNKNKEKWITTHIRIVGSVPRLLKSGKRKGEKTWKDSVDEKEFILSWEEFNEVKQQMKNKSQI